MPDPVTTLAACLTICTFATLTSIAYWRKHPVVQPQPPPPPPAPIPVSPEVAPLLHADNVLGQAQVAIRNELHCLDNRQCAWDMMSTKHKFWYFGEVSRMNAELLDMTTQRRELARKIEACNTVNQQEA